jgi:hypothetical protein
MTEEELEREAIIQESLDSQLLRGIKENPFTDKIRKIRELALLQRMRNKQKSSVVDRKLKSSGE